MSSVSVRSLDSDRVLAALRDLAGRIGEAHPEVLEIRLFGSLARGERNPYADADLLIVVDRCELPFRDRAQTYKPVAAPLPTDVIVCTAAELERETAAGNLFVGRILAEGLVLYARSAVA